MIPEVSVIVAVYNTEKYLRCCLDSILTQSFAEMEIICIDDCSTDGSPEILREYAERDSRIRVVRQPENRGTGMGRLAGIEAAAGEYILFVDGDDCWTGDGLTRVLAAAKTTGADIVAFDFAIGGDSNPELRHCLQKCRRGRRAGILTGRAICDDYFFDGQLPMLWSKLYRTSLCKLLLQHVKPGYYLKEDPYFYPVLCCFAEKYVYVPEICYRYELGEGISADDSAIKFPRFRGLCSLVDATMALKVFLQNQNLYERYREVFERNEAEWLYQLLDAYWRRLTPEDRVTAQKYLEDRYGMELLLNGFRAAVSHYENSRSWKLTAPLRSLMKKW